MLRASSAAIKNACFLKRVLESFFDRLFGIIRRSLPLSHEVPSRPPGFLDSSSEKGPGAAGSTLSLGLGQRFIS